MKILVKFLVFDIYINFMEELCKWVKEWTKFTP